MFIIMHNLRKLFTPLGSFALHCASFLLVYRDGVFPAQTMEPIPYEKAIEGLDTGIYITIYMHRCIYGLTTPPPPPPPPPPQGDLILFSGATSAGALIKFFDHSQFSHVALVLKAQYTSQLLIWEASTNHASK